MEEEIEIFDIPKKAKKFNWEQAFIIIFCGVIIATYIMMLARAASQEEITKALRAHNRQQDRRLYGIANAAASQQIAAIRERLTESAEIAARRAIHEHFNAYEDVPKKDK